MEYISVLDTHVTWTVIGELDRKELTASSEPLINRPLKKGIKGFEMGLLSIFDILVEESGLVDNCLFFCSPSSDHSGTCARIFPSFSGCVLS